MTNNKEPDLKFLDEMDEAISRDADLYSRGKELSEIFDKIDPLDENAKDAFFESILGSDPRYSQAFDEEALKHYGDEQHKEHMRNAAKASQNQATRDPAPKNKKPVYLQEMIDKFVKENQNSARAWKRSQALCVPKAFSGFPAALILSAKCHKPERLYAIRA